MRRSIFLLLCSLSFNHLFSQPSNSSCENARWLNNSSDYCSDIAEFTNVDGDNDLSFFVTTPPCFDENNHDVWFQFIANSSRIRITVRGQTNDDMQGGTLKNPQIYLLGNIGCFSGGDGLRCESDSENVGEVTLTTLDLIRGERYYIVVDGGTDEQGTFQLCLEDLPVAQNDECTGAIDLGIIDNDGFCSEVGFYNNRDATSSIGTTCTGSSQLEHDVWFQFTPTNSAVSIQLFSRTPGASENIIEPALGLYRGNCNNLEEIVCRETREDILEVFQSNLTIGEPVVMRIDGSTIGNFHFCIRSNPPIPSPESDCPKAVFLCDKSSFEVPNLRSTGDIQNELIGPCIDPSQNGTPFDQRSEEGSAWYTWVCDQAGSLTFVLDPNNPNSTEEDLDWILYELPAGLGDCENRLALRCMLSGESGGNSPAQNAPCVLATGLREGETDVNEFAGCEDGSNNFLAPLQMESGKTYALIVNNFSSSGFGFSIEFGGTGTFLGADPDFGFELVTGEQLITCDNEIVFTDFSLSVGDPIREWQWNFGSEAVPSSATGQGPHNVFFDSIGEKQFTLSVVTDRGCEITETKIITIEDCCQELNTTLEVSASIVQKACLDEENGVLIASAEGGGGCIGTTDFYLYSLDGINFQESPLFENLDQGEQSVYVKDCKGCVRSTTAIIEEYDPIAVDAGSDLSFETGDIINLNGSYDPPETRAAVINWSPTIDFIDCLNCLNPELLVTGSNTFTLEIKDENGCLYEDSVDLVARIVKDIYIPNIFAPQSLTDNGAFTIRLGKSVAEIMNFEVFDRWGNRVYEAKNLISLDSKIEWDGIINGQMASSGVYIYLLEARFVNGDIDNFVGDVTIIR